MGRPSSRLAPQWVVASLLSSTGRSQVDALAVLLIGFSVFSALTLALAHLRGEAYRDLPQARHAGLVLLLALAALQGAHFAHLQFHLAWTDTPGYRVMLFIVAPAFFLFSRPILEPARERLAGWQIGAHAAPALGAAFVPAALAWPMAFTLGAGYLVWLARGLYALRGSRAHFRAELLLLGVAFGLAVGMAGLGLWADARQDRLFLSLYASAIGLAFLLVQLTLGLRPRLSEDVQDTARTGYAQTTLAKVDCEAALARLEGLMGEERVYADPHLDLAGLAGRLGLGAHQLSELVNSRLGKGFSRYLREQRVAAAQAMLVSEPRASVLSVGLSVGFTSTSNFYEAFREIVGCTPGQFRKLQGPPDSPVSFPK